MTGLTTTTAEAFQTQNYGIGGHYNPHWDHRLKHEPKFEQDTGNRIATILFYVSSPSLGIP